MLFSTMNFAASSIDLPAGIVTRGPLDDVSNVHVLLILRPAKSRIHWDIWQRRLSHV